MQGIDLTAGRFSPRPLLSAPPRILMFDSGLGGLTVFVEARKARPDADIIYVADDAAFPYGSWGEADLVTRIVSLMGDMIAAHGPDCVVIACNTASTLALPALRARFGVPFIGTVPAIKPAAERSASRLISVLATPATVSRDYTKSLIESYAGSCAVTLVGSPRLAGLAEARMRGEPADDAAILAEIAPCFVTHDGRRTDVVTLSCTHYPLLLDRFVALAPWPVAWIDPAPAVARRLVHLLGPAPRHDLAPPGSAAALFTAGPPAAALAPVLSRFGFDEATLPR